MGRCLVLNDQNNISDQTQRHLCPPLVALDVNMVLLKDEDLGLSPGKFCFFLEQNLIGRRKRGKKLCGVWGTRFSITLLRLPKMYEKIAESP